MHVSPVHTTGAPPLRLKASLKTQYHEPGPTEHEHSHGRSRVRTSALHAVHQEEVDPHSPSSTDSQSRRIDGHNGGSKHPWMTGLPHLSPAFAEGSTTPNANGRVIVECNEERRKEHSQGMACCTVPQQPLHNKWTPPPPPHPLRHNAGVNKSLWKHWTM